MLLCEVLEKLCGQNAEFFSVKNQAVRILTTVL
jgi:hypothetical protein